MSNFKKIHRLIDVMLIVLLMTGSTAVFAFAADTETDEPASPAKSEVTEAVKDIEDKPDAAKVDEEKSVDLNDAVNDVNVNNEENVAVKEVSVKESISTEDDAAKTETAIEESVQISSVMDNASASDSDAAVTESADEVVAASVAAGNKDVLKDEVPDPANNDGEDLSEAVVEYVVEVAPAAIRVYDDYSDYEYTADDDGTITVDNFLIAFGTGGTANETVEMLVNGSYYTFVVYSDGTTEGKLPKGFSVVDGKLVITGYGDNLDVYITGHSAVSSTFENDAETSSTYTPAVNNRNMSSVFALSAAFVPFETAAEEFAAVVKQDKEVKATEITADADESESEVLGIYEDSSSTKLPPAAVLAVLSVVAVGLGALLKLGVIRI